jgi:hypothetical protein
MIHPPWNVSKTIPHTKMSSGPFRRELPDAAAVEGDRINGLLPESDEGRVAESRSVSDRRYVYWLNESSFTFG